MIRVRSPIGARFSAHCTAAKAALAYLPEEELDTIFSIAGLTPNTPFTPDRADERNRGRGFRKPRKPQRGGGT